MLWHSVEELFQLVTNTPSKLLLRFFRRARPLPITVSPGATTVVLPFTLSTRLWCTSVLFSLAQKGAHLGTISISIVNLSFSVAISAGYSVFSQPLLDPQGERQGVCREVQRQTGRAGKNRRREEVEIIPEGAREANEHGQEDGDDNTARVCNELLIRVAL